MALWSHAPGSQPRAGFDDDVVTRLYLALCFFMLASFAVFVPALLMDPRTLDGAQVWIKPQKFNVSLALHFFTLALLSQLLPRDVRRGPAMLIASFLAAGALILEFVYISIQAGRARRSHFNYETPLEGAMYAAMGVGAVLLVVVALVLAIQIWRKGEGRGSGLWLGSVVGLSLGCISTLVFASYMSSQGRYVGSPLGDGGVAIPIVGWSREYGDLRPAHFVSLHLMQTVPLAGWLSDRLHWKGRWVIAGVTGVQLLLALALFMQARAGQSIWPLCATIP